MMSSGMKVWLSGFQMAASLKREDERLWWSRVVLMGVG